MRHITLTQTADGWSAELYGAAGRIDGAATQAEAVGRLVMLLCAPLKIRIHVEKSKEKA